MGAVIQGPREVGREDSELHYWTRLTGRPIPNRKRWSARKQIGKQQQLDPFFEGQST